MKPPITEWNGLCFVFCFWLILAPLVSAAMYTCPSACKCNPSDNFNSTNFHLFRRKDTFFMMMVFCERQDLTKVPSEMPPGISRLHLSHNKIVSLNARTFENVTSVTALVLADNLISRIDNDTFHSLYDLEYLDLSDNLMRTIPELMLCLWKSWKPPGVKSDQDLNSVEDIQCPISPVRKRILSLDLSGNKWHCTCYLQQMIKAYSCLRNYNEVCVRFLPVAEDPSAIGYCTSPLNIKNIPLNRLRAEEIPEFPRAQMVNLCLKRSSHVDVVLLVVMFTWMGITMGCVMHFVAWNNREVERHKSYIAGLDKTAPKGPPAPPPQALPSPPLSRKCRGFPEERRNPDIAINGNIVERSERPDVKRFMKQTSISPQASPVWKPRSYRQQTYPASKRSAQYSPRTPPGGTEIFKR